MFDWAELMFSLGIAVLAVIVGGTDPIKKPYKVKVCLVASGPEAEDMTTEIWSDQIERYFERYPGSYCGICGEEPRECPKQ